MSMSFRDLDVWKRSIALASEIYRVTKMLPPDEKFGLTAQMRRSAVSISCNIAEGYGRATRGEYLNHLSMARGSLNEVETLCVICRELGLLSEESLGVATSEIDRIRRMLGRLRMRLLRLKPE